MMNLQFITHRTHRYDYAEGVELALKGGCEWVQLRMKDVSDDDFLQVGRKVKTLCAAYGATFILDDRVHLVKALRADGVHLGKQDMAIDEARRQLNDDSLLIGGTANTMEDIRKLCEMGANYIGCGPFRYTSTKKNLAPLLGLEGYSRLMRTMKEERLLVPVVAIGGILREDIPAIAKTGVSGIAVSGAILHADNPKVEMQRFVEATINI
ncbi:UNVERIFIED_CONTAM: thiamine phosphate synthase [Prevotella sp. 15_C9]